MVLGSLGIKLRRMFGGKTEPVHDQPSPGEATVPGMTIDSQDTPLPAGVSASHQQVQAEAIDTAPKVLVAETPRPIIDRCCNNPKGDSTGLDQMSVKVEKMNPFEERAPGSGSAPITLGSTEATADGETELVKPIQDNLVEAGFGGEKTQTDVLSMPSNSKAGMLIQDKTISDCRERSLAGSNVKVKKAAKRRSAKTEVQPAKAPRESQRARQKGAPAKDHIDASKKPPLPLSVAAAPVQTENN